MPRSHSPNQGAKKRKKISPFAAHEPPPPPIVGHMTRGPTARHRHGLTGLGPCRHSPTTGPCLGCSLGTGRLGTALSKKNSWGIQHRLTSAIWGTTQRAEGYKIDLFQPYMTTQKNEEENRLILCRSTMGCSAFAPARHGPSLIGTWM